MNEARRLARNLLVAGISLVLAAGLASRLERTSRDEPTDVPSPPGLAEWIPRQVGPWQLISAHAGQNPIINAETQPLYGEVLSRIYQTPDGETIMLSIAWGADQTRDELQAHRPEYCYRAFGFDVAHLADQAILTNGGRIPVRRMLATRSGRVEPVSYWMTVGHQAVLPGWSRAWAQWRRNLAGKQTDGLLIRVSSLSRDAAKAFEQHNHFIRTMLDPLNGRERFGVHGTTSGRHPSRFSEHPSEPTASQRTQGVSS